MRPCVLILLLLAACGEDGTPAAAEDVQEADVWIRGGDVVDGSNKPRYRADVLVKDGRIIGVGDFEPERIRATTVLDAAGKVVAPGFIDVHAHGDPIRTPEMQSFLAMGVTTICIGQDGSSPGGRDPGAWLAKVDAARPGVNVCALAGHGSLRRMAGIKDGEVATPARRTRLIDLVVRYMDAGFLGLSLGLEYDPGRFADRDELVAAATSVAQRKGVVMAHVRNEDSGQIVGSIEELLEVGKLSGARVHVSHIKVVLGQDDAEATRVLDVLGDTTADLYPYTASFTGLSILFPDWARPPHRYADVVDVRRQDLLDHLDRRVRARNGPEAMLFGSGPHAGKTLSEVAAEADKPFPEVLAGLGPRGTSAAYFVMRETDVERFARHPSVAFASDGSPGMRHPRGHGTFAEVVGPFVRRGVVSLEEAVRKATSLPARILGLENRGALREGMVADVVVFDPERVRSRADFVRPHQKAEGFEAVLVNGVLVRNSGTFNGLRSGRVLRRRPR